MSESYRQGFVQKCAEMGVDPEQLAKSAGVSSALLKLLNRPVGSIGGIAGTVGKGVAGAFKAAPVFSGAAAAGAGIYGYNKLRDLYPAMRAGVRDDETTREYFPGDMQSAIDNPGVFRGARDVRDIASGIGSALGFGGPDYYEMNRKRDEQRRNDSTLLGGPAYPNQKKQP